MSNAEWEICSACDGVGSDANANFYCHVCHAEGSLLLRGPRAHSIAWMLDDDWLTGTVTCHAAEGADCRMMCPEGCESWDLIDHEHTLVDAGKCNAVESLDANGVADSHVGSHAPVDGFITPEWDIDVWQWSYSDA